MVIQPEILESIISRNRTSITCRSIGRLKSRLNRVGRIYTGNQVREMTGRKKDPLYKSFGYAFQGIFTCIRNERNMKIHCTVAVLVVIAGVILGLSMTEWCICLGLFGMVMSLELVNTAVESVVDLVTQERKPLAKIAKDTAAGAVLIAAIMAAIVGLIIFVPKGLAFLGVL